MSNNQVIFNLVATALSGYGGYMLTTSPLDGPWENSAKFIAALVGGIVYLLYSNKDYLTSFAVKRPQSAQVFVPEDFEEQDFKSLIHLRNRVASANSKEGLETCAKLNDIIFSLHAAARNSERI